MTELDEALARLTAHEGVERLLLVGHDGLLVRELGGSEPLAVDTVAAMVPGLAAACGALGRAAERGPLSTAVVELGEGVVVIAPLSVDVLLAIFLRPGVGFAPLLRALRQERGLLANLL